MNNKVTHDGKTVDLNQPIETFLKGYPAKFMGTVPKGFNGAVYTVAWQMGGNAMEDQWNVSLFNEKALVGNFRNVRLNPFRETLTEARLAEEYVAWRKREGANPVVRFGQYIVNNYGVMNRTYPVKDPFGAIFYEQQAGKAFVMIYDLIKGDE